MRAALTVLAVSALALSVASCNRDKKAEDGAAPAPGGSATAPAAAPPSTPAGPITLPHRKPGLWEVSMTMEGESQPPIVSRLCLDAASEARSSIWGADITNEMCSKHDMVRQLDGSWKFSSVCNMGSGGVTRSEGTASGDLSTNYTVRMRSSTSGAELEMMNRDAAYTVASRRIGACEPGQKGGDMIMNGRVVANINDLAAASGKAARP